MTRRNARQTDVAFDENSDVAGTVDFDWRAVEGAAEELNEGELRKYRQELARRLLEWLCANGRTPHRIGVTVLVLVHILNGGRRADLASRLHVSRQRVHALLTRARRELAFLKGLGAL